MKKMFLCACLFLPTFLNALNYVEIEDQCGLQIATPSLVERKVCKLRLENGLEALLISDPGIYESGASLAVGVGSWNDPAQRPGMAHFVEHMLFLGTEKYPEEEDYMRYLDQYNGKRNAFTSMDRTVYMFSVVNEGFLGSLDRFAQFFIAPLFNPSGVERESIAIDQEFTKDCPLDPWRIHFVQKELANPTHPFHQFCIGNKETLAKISQDELKQWYANHYSADLMHLVVYSSLPIEVLKEEVSSLFSQVKVNFQKKQQDLDIPLLSSKTKGQLVAVSPVQQIQLLELTWEVPSSFFQDKDVKAEELVSYLIGHEGAESLIAQLKKEKFATSISSGTFKAGLFSQGLFQVSIQLTELGVKEIETVIQRCFEALASYKKEPFSKTLFDEICSSKTTAYLYQEREDAFDFVMKTATALLDEPLETYPKKTLIPTQYSAQKVTDFLNYLTPDKCRYTLVANPKTLKAELTEKEKWMGVSYSILPISKDSLEKWSLADPHANITFPSNNPFIPHQFALKHSSYLSENLGITIPSLIAESGRGILYFASDDRFQVPEVSLAFTIKSPQIDDGSAHLTTLIDLYCYLVKEKLTETAYQAKLAGLSYTLTPTNFGLKLTINGFHDKAEVFLEQVIHKMKSLEVSKEEFLTARDDLQKQYHNKFNKTPVAQALDHLSSILYKEYAPLQDREKTIRGITYEEFERYCQKLLNRCYVQATFYGNQIEEEAFSVWKHCENLLDASPYPKSEHPKTQLATFKDEPVILEKQSKALGNALLLMVDCGDLTFKRRAAQEILTKALDEPFFSELRTKQQTGYFVTNGSKEIEKHLYSYFLVQSATHDTRDLLSRFELFLENSMRNLTSLCAEERFNALKTSLLNQLSHPATKIDDMCEILHRYACDYQADFNWFSKRIEGYKELSYDEFLSYSREFLGPKNLKRVAICINGQIPSKEALFYKKINGLQKLRQTVRYENEKIAP